MPLRSIDDVLLFREDISLFLVHLTKSVGTTAASKILESIITEGQLRPGDSEVSDARFGIYTKDLTNIEKSKLSGALCFTETPISEIHCLLEIGRRQVNLDPYGLVFLKERLGDQGVGPVWYLNNVCGDKDTFVKALCSLTSQKESILPMIAVFGKKLVALGASNRGGEVDFRWEREWRRPWIEGELKFTPEDVFIGLCPYDEIESFEGIFSSVEFINPKMNMKWFASKLIRARQRVDLKVSVI